MTTATQSIFEAVATFEAQADCLFDWIEGMSDADLDATPVAGKLSMRTLVIHMYDSDAVGLDRMKRVIAAKGEAAYATEHRPPLLLGYEENDFMRELPETVDLETVARCFADGRRLLAVRLRALPESAFARVGVHSEVGVKTLAALVQSYVTHVEYHAKFASEKRVKLGHSAL
jgi:hypothetical protein